MGLGFRIIGIKTDENTMFRESPLIFCTLFPTCFHHSWANIKQFQIIKKRSVEQILYSMLNITYIGIQNYGKLHSCNVKISSFWLNCLCLMSLSACGSALGLPPCRHDRFVFPFTFPCVRLPSVDWLLWGK